MPRGPGAGCACAILLRAAAKGMRRGTVGAALAVAVVLAPAQADEAERLAAALAGEWNNNEQVWQQKIDAAKPAAAGTAQAAAVPHGHWVLAPVSLPKLPGRWLYLQAADGSDPSRVRAQALLRFSAEAEGVQIEVRALREPERWIDLHRAGPGRDEARARIDDAALATEPRCPGWTLRAQAGGYGAAPASAATSVAESCAVAIQGLSAAGVLQHGPAGSQRSRKVRYFEGWVWFRNAGPGAAPDDKDTSFTARCMLHTEGQQMVLLRKDGSETPWLLELAQLTYQNTRRPILKLALLDRASGKSIAYIWANTEATNVGMNLGWFQAGVTQRPGAVHFAPGD